MKLHELIRELQCPDCLDKFAATDKEIVFDTRDTGGLQLLSVYYNDEDDLIHIDVGERNG